jgi:hypothetical protein
MKKKLTICFPKESKKRYLSLETHNYSSLINIYFNNNIVCSNINDCEENLPMAYQYQIDFDPHKINTIMIQYNIQIGKVQEDASIQYQIRSISCGSCNVTAQLLRNNFVISPELLSPEYVITSKINDHQININGKSWFTGNSTQQTFDTNIDIAEPLILETISKKIFVSSNQVYYDHIQLSLI